MKELFYENCILRNTNYYLVCTIYHLEKQKIEQLNKCIKDADNISLQNINNNPNNPNIAVVESEELLNLMKKKEDEYMLLKNELQNIKIEMEIQKDFTTHKIQNLESVKQKLEEEIKAMKEDPNPEITKEIEKLKRENVMLSINNKQLQFELIRSIKLRE